MKLFRRHNMYMCVKDFYYEIWKYRLKHKGKTSPSKRLVQQFSFYLDHPLRIGTILLCNLSAPRALDCTELTSLQTFTGIMVSPLCLTGLGLCKQNNPEIEICIKSFSDKESSILIIFNLILVLERLVDKVRMCWYEI